MTRRASRLGSAMHRSAPRSLPDTAFLTTTGDLAARMVDGIHAYLDRQLAAAPKTRQAMWEAENLSAAEATKFVAARRDELRQIVGVIDDRIEPSLKFEIPEFDQGNTFGYAEMAGLIAPRPFMVERGHDDGVAPDERVAFEYAKVSRMYAKLGIPERTEIEYFAGGHEIHAQGTFDFLHKHLDWPGPGN